MNLVLPIINLSILDADILIFMQQLIFGWSSTGDHPETLLLFELFCFSSCLKVIGGWWWWWVMAYRILLSAPGPFGFNWVLVLIGTWLGFGLRDLGAEGSDIIPNFLSNRLNQNLDIFILILHTINLGKI